jgi:hypothetical protein
MNQANPQGMLNTMSGPPETCAHQDREKAGSHDPNIFKMMNN